MECIVDTVKLNEVVKSLVKELATTNAVNQGLLERLEKVEERLDDLETRLPVESSEQPAEN